MYGTPGSDIWKQVMSNLPFPYPELAQRMYITSSRTEHGNITKYYVLQKESYMHFIRSSYKCTLSEDVF